MRKVTEKTFKAYAKEAVKQLNTLELFAALRFTAVGVEISLYRNGVEVGHISIQDNGWVHAEDLARDDEFEIIPEHDTMKDLFKAVYTTVNGLLDNGWFMQEEPEQVEEVTDEPKQYFSVTFEKNGIYSANIAHAVKKSDVEAHYSKYNNCVIGEAKGYEVEEAERKHMPIVEIEPVKEEAEEPQPTPEEADREVTYIDFKPEQDYSEEEQKEIAETVAGVGLELLEKELTELEKLEEESDKADDAWDKDPLNAELEAASSKAYEKEWKKYMDAAKTLARLINMDTKTARQMLLRGSKNREKVWNYLKRMKVYENK